MKTITREQILLMLLPAAIVALFYTAMPFMGSVGRSVNPSAQVGKLADDLKKSRKQSPPPRAIALMQSVIGKTQKNVNELRKQKKTLETQWHSLQELYNKTPPWPEETKVSIQQLLKEQGLYVTTVTGSKLAIPSSLQKVYADLNKGKSSNKDRHIIEFHFVGRYADVLRWLNALAASDLPVIPISLTMKEASLDTEYREWQLAIWI